MLPHFRETDPPGIVSRFSLPDNFDTKLRGSVQWRRTEYKFGPQLAPASSRIPKN